MSKRRPACGKKKYRDKIAAMMAIANIEARGEDRPSGQIPKRAYKCPACHQWHLTSKELN